MSELACAAGTAAPGRTIEHNGKTFVFRSALDNATLLALEARLYDRARTALAGLRGEYTEEQYASRLEALQEKYESGHFGMYSEATRKFLNTEKGVVVLLQALTDATEGELVELLRDRQDDMGIVLKGVLKATYPDQKESAGPKGRARR